jgi:hypothetical protein
MLDTYMVWRTDGHYWGYTEFDNIEDAVMYAQPEDIICKRVKIQIRETY